MGRNPTHRRAMRLAGLSAGLAGLAALACGNARPADVILVTVDTLRRDHLSCYGYARDTSPHVDRLAEDGMLFANAVVPRPLTSPSVASALTGLYTHRHGVRNNFMQLHDSVTRLPELLGAHGYQTAAFVSNAVLVASISNLQRGFDVYDDFLPDRELNRELYERNAAATVESALGWLDVRDERPFFLWVHLIDPHGPYDPPRAYATRFRSPPSTLLSRDQIPTYQYLRSLDYGFYVDRYDGEIAYADEMIGRLLDGLRERDLYRDGLIVFHADHGEALGENGFYFMHGQDLHAASVDIPLVMKLPARRGAAFTGRTDVLASVTDLLPTILDALDLPIPEDLDGESLLRAVARGRRNAPAVLLERVGALGLAPPQVGLRTQTEKLIYDLRKGEPFAVETKRFFQVDRDPEERRDAYAPDDPRVRALDAELSGWLERLADFELPFEPVDKHPPGRPGQDPQELRALRALGYLE
ncbi:MAG TPA: sulfatase [Myxococcota bacterium]